MKTNTKSEKTLEEALIDIYINLKIQENVFLFLLKIR